MRVTAPAAAVSRRAGQVISHAAKPRGKAGAQQDERLGCFGQARYNEQRWALAPGVIAAAVAPGVALASDGLAREPLPGLAQRDRRVAHTVGGTARGARRDRFAHDSFVPLPGGDTLRCSLQ